MVCRHTNGQMASVHGQRRSVSRCEPLFAKALITIESKMQYKPCLHVLLLLQLAAQALGLSTIASYSDSACHHVTFKTSMYACHAVRVYCFARWFCGVQRTACSWRKQRPRVVQWEGAGASAEPGNTCCWAMYLALACMHNARTTGTALVDNTATIATKARDKVVGSTSS